MSVIEAKFMITERKGLENSPFSYMPLRAFKMHFKEDYIISNKITIFTAKNTLYFNLRYVS